MFEGKAMWSSDIDDCRRFCCPIPVQVWTYIVVLSYKGLRIYDVYELKIIKKGTSDHRLFNFIKKPLGTLFDIVDNELLIYSTYFFQDLEKNKNKYSLNGGKIVEKANAWGNFQDSDNDLSRKSNHTIDLQSNGLNSILFITFTNKSNLTNSNNFRGTLKKFRRNYSTIRWPTDWATVEKDVREKQMKLVKIANETGGIHSKEVYRFQRTMSLELNVRLLAVQIVTTNKGSKTPGIDGK